MTTQTQPWLRAELIAAPETSPGAQLMIPADGIEFHDDQIVFHHQGDIVYVAPRAQLRAIAWLARQPNPAAARRRAQWPNHGTRWTDEEREDLLRRLQAGEAWKTISTAHGRSRSGCQQEAVKQGWLHADTLLLKPEFEVPNLTAAAASTDDTGESQAQPPTAPDATATSPEANRDTAPPAARHATRAALPGASTHPDSATHAPPGPDGSGTDETASAPVSEAPAGPHHRPAPGFATTAPPTAGTATAAASSPNPITGSAARHTAAPYLLPGPPVPDAYSRPVTPDVADAASSSPDRQPFPPRVPRQRSNPDPLPRPEPGSGPDSEPGPESGPRPGSRFLSRAQSSLARATLGAYMNPPRGESGTAPGTT